jgi:hypothetical protein
MERDGTVGRSDAIESNLTPHRESVRGHSQTGQVESRKTGHEPRQAKGRRAAGANIVIGATRSATHHPRIELLDLSLHLPSPTGGGEGLEHGVQG